MPIELNIRPAQESDIREILSITREAFAKYAHDLGLPHTVMALRDTESDIAAALREKTVLIGELDGEAQGTIRYEIINGIAYFSRFGVRLAAQSCGLGRRLVQAVVQGAADSGCRAVALHTSARMASLIRFYYGQGFFINSIDSERGYYRALLVRELPPQDGCIDYAPLLNAQVPCSACAALVRELPPQDGCIDYAPLLNAQVPCSACAALVRELPPQDGCIDYAPLLSG